MLRTTGVGQKIVELLKRRTVNCRTSGIAPNKRGAEREKKEKKRRTVCYYTFLQAI